ncbi:hypothetical protein PRK78_005292 [Emydomyces testavorans]|uniref:Uncharacterized protein n=1 Tax=Emydomyces testavorans TaxID=2070801 RepID=A0AAF0DLG5_9EURO|nr:hypothetical protein PRK78_005292 [Emydomyces testavorans]
MRFEVFSFSIVLIGGVLANDWVKTEPFHIKARLARRGTQGSSFTPGTTPGTGKSCEGAFGAGFAECAASGGVSREECAAKLSVTLKSTTQPQTSQQSSATKSPSSPVVSPAVKPAVMTTTICPSASHPPYPTGSPNATSPGTAVQSLPSNSPVFTGAASPQNTVQGAVTFVALLGVLRNLL